MIAKTALLALCCVSVRALYSDDDRVQVLSTDEFKSKVLGGDRMWVVEWFAPWCGGCRMASPWYKEAAALMEKAENHAIPFAAMDMDSEGVGTEGAKYGVSGMPHISTSGARTRGDGLLLPHTQTRPPRLLLLLLLPLSMSSAPLSRS